MTQRIQVEAGPNLSDNRFVEQPAQPVSPPADPMRLTAGRAITLAVIVLLVAEFIAMRATYQVSNIRQVLDRCLGYSFWVSAFWVGIICVAAPVRYLLSKESGGRIDNPFASMPDLFRVKTLLLGVAAKTAIFAILSILLSLPWFYR